MEEKFVNLTVSRLRSMRVKESHTLRIGARNSGRATREPLIRNSKTIITMKQRRKNSIRNTKISKKKDLSRSGDPLVRLIVIGKRSKL